MVETKSKEQLLKERRRKYNRNYYDKHRFKLLKISSDKRDELKGKIKLIEN
tara:strand:+ start:478 stop:630 length:153 start_codon:yes stop_codon:yes gene_type:complete